MNFIVYFSPFINVIFFFSLNVHLKQLYWDIFIISCKISTNSYLNVITGWIIERHTKPWRGSSIAAAGSLWTSLFPIPERITTVTIEKAGSGTWAWISWFTVVIATNIGGWSGWTTIITWAVNAATSLWCVCGICPYMWLQNAMSDAHSLNIGSTDWTRAVKGFWTSYLSPSDSTTHTGECSSSSGVKSTVAHIVWS